MNTIENYISENIEIINIGTNEGANNSETEIDNIKNNEEFTFTVQKEKKSQNEQKESIDNDVTEKDKAKKINVIENIIINNIIDLNNEENVDKLDLDPFMIATQKLPDSKNNSNCEEKLKDKNSSCDKEYVIATQKLNLNITEEHISPDAEHLEDVQEIKSQTDILEMLDNNINACINCIENVSYDEMKKKLNLSLVYIKKLKNFTKRSKLSTSVQTNSVKTVDKTVETMTVDRCHKEAQTDIEIIDRGVQTTLTENSYSQNNSEQNFIEQKARLKINLANSITQGTKKALESFWSEPDMTVPNTLKEFQNKISSNNSNLASRAQKEKTQNEIFTASFDNVNFETQEVAKQLLQRKVSSSSKSEASSSNVKEIENMVVRSPNYGAGSPQASKVSTFVESKKSLIFSPVKIDIHGYNSGQRTEN